MAIINFNSISGVSTISVASSITVGNNVSIGTDRVTATGFVGNVTGNVTGTVNSSGIATFSSGLIVSAGTTSAPSISPTGDSNTGIFFPSPDTIAFAEGGAESARFDSSGNFGLGTNNPQIRLDVRQDSSSTSTMAGVRVQNTNIAESSQSGIAFLNYDNYSAKIYSPRSGSSQGNIVFATNNGNGISESNVVERLRITSGGNLGVATSNPNYTLHSAGSSAFGDATYPYIITHIGYIYNGVTYTLPSGRWAGELHYTWGNNTGRTAKRIVGFSKAPGAAGNGYSSTITDLNSGGGGVLAYSFNQSTGVFTWSVSDGSASTGYAWILYHRGE